MPEPQRKDDQIDERQLTIAAYKDFFATDKGKRVLDNLSRHCLGLDEFHLFDVSSARQTDFNLGKNDVIRHIRCMLKQKTEPKPEKVIS